MAFAMENNDEYILAGCEEVLVHNFDDLPSVVSGLSKEMFEKLIRRDDLNISNEEIVFKAICAWFEVHESEPDCPTFAHLLSNLRLDQIQLTTLEATVRRHHQVAKDLVARHALIFISFCFEGTHHVTFVLQISVIGKSICYEIAELVCKFER